jgi:hypothetical protein
MSCQGLEGNSNLDATDSELVGAEVYDKVIFPSYLRRAHR